MIFLFHDKVNQREKSDYHHILCDFLIDVRSFTKLCKRSKNAVRRRPSVRNDSTVNLFTNSFNHHSDNLLSILIFFLFKWWDYNIKIPFNANYFNTFSFKL